jgi:NYN domain-containing protein
MPERIKSALFVDFDNIFLGLRDENPRAPLRFARNPGRWLEWVHHEMPCPLGSDGQPTVRDVLVRRCYGNPKTFGDYRHAFTQAGFGVVDCPALTGQGKNSADIVMVMDVLDFLGHATRFDEFIIMSTDADFTPLMLRLRAFDRRTVAIVAGNAAAAYAASCDLVVSDEEFVERALLLPPGVAAPPRPAARPVATQPARRVPSPPVPRPVDAAPPPPEPTVPSAEAAPATAAANGRPSDDELRLRIVEEVRRFVRASPGPVMTPRVAQVVGDALGPIVRESNWAGAGSFTSLLRGIPDLGLTIVRPTPTVPGFIYDPALHAPPQVDGAARPAEKPRATPAPPIDHLASLAEPLRSFAERLCEAAGVPRLNPGQFQALYRSIGRALRDAPLDPDAVSKVVRDDLVPRGHRVGRAQAHAVLAGLVEIGYHPHGAGSDEAPSIAEAYRGYVLNRLRTDGIILDVEEIGLLDEWLGPPSAAATPVDQASAPTEMAPAEAEAPAAMPSAEDAVHASAASPPEFAPEDTDAALRAWLDQWRTDARPDSAPRPWEHDGALPEQRAEALPASAEQAAGHAPGSAEGDLEASAAYESPADGAGEEAQEISAETAIAAAEEASFHDQGDEAAAEPQPERAATAHVPSSESAEAIEWAEPPAHPETVPAQAEIDEPAPWDESAADPEDSSEDAAEEDDDAWYWPEAPRDGEAAPVEDWADAHETETHPASAAATASSADWPGQQDAPDALHATAESATSNGGPPLPTAEPVRTDAPRPAGLDWQLWPPFDGHKG